MTGGAATTWRSENAEWLALALQRLRLRLNRRALWRQGTSAGAPRQADWLVADAGADDEARFYADDPSSQALHELDAEFRNRLDAHEHAMRATSRPPALRELSERVALSPFEEALLLAAAAPGIDGAFARAFAELNDDPSRPYPTLQLALGLFVGPATDRLVAGDCLMPGRPLRALRLIEVADDGDEPLLLRRLAADERMTDYLRGVSRVDARVLAVVGELAPTVSNDALDATAATAAAFVIADGDRWATVNLVGALEGGAREVAIATCARLGLRLFAVDLQQFASMTPAERGTLFALLGREALLSGVALLIDTALAERGSAAAAVVDEVIERVAATLFVVSAERWPGGSEAHRAAHVLRVARPTRSEQRSLWQTALAPHRHSLNGEVDELVQQFDFGPTAIATAVSRASRHSDGPITPQDIRRSCREEIGAALDTLAVRITPSYVWDDIVVSDDVRGQLRELAGQVANRGRVYETWGFGAQLGRGRGITALFAGASGTGKTMAAEIVAAALDLDLYRIDLAGVVSKYIGETEKNLRRVFDAAERSGAILFFDEADALFGSRTEVRDSHDRYANVEINYLLQRMEDYAGLAILATNRRAALDGAFVRRLRFVIDFPIPGADERRSIWQKIFPARAETDGIDYSQLSRLELTGGNIRSIAINAAFLAAGERTPIRMNHLARAAGREYTKLAKPISASEFGPYYAEARS